MRATNRNGTGLKWAMSAIWSHSRTSRNPPGVSSGNLAIPPNLNWHAAKNCEFSFLSTKSPAPRILKPQGKKRILSLFVSAEPPKQMSTYTQRGTAPKTVASILSLFRSALKSTGLTLRQPSYGFLLLGFRQACFWVGRRRKRQAGDAAVGRSTLSFISWGLAISSFVTLYAHVSEAGRAMV